MVAVLFVCMLLAGTASAQERAPGGTCAIVTHREDLPALREPLERYCADVRGRWPGVRFKLLADRRWQSAAEVRRALKRLRTSTRPPLEGAILVGRLPLARYRAHLHRDTYRDEGGNVGVMPMYFQDLDGCFEDPDGDSVFEDGDVHQGPQHGAEIWVSFLYPSALERGSGLAQVRSFLHKTHRYYQGELDYNGRVLLWQTLSVAPANADVNELVAAFDRSEIDHYGKDGTATDPETGRRVLERTDLEKLGVLTKENCPVPVWKYHGPDNPLLHQLRGLANRNYDLCEIHYGGGYSHAYLLLGDVRSLDASPKIVALNACRTGQFDYRPRSSIALAWLYETEGTLAVMGPTVEASWSQLYNLVYREMARGAFLGRAWCAKDRTSELDAREVNPRAEPGPTHYHDHTKPSRGSALLGDPFLPIRG